MEILEILKSVGLAIAVTATMALVDYAHARYTLDMQRLRIIRAAFWSVAQWGAASVGFIVAVRVSIWYLPFEAVGLFIGTWLGGRRRTVFVEQGVKKPCLRIVKTEK